MVSGFPPPDTILREWFEERKSAGPNEQSEVAKRLRGFVYSLLTVLLDRLKIIAKERDKSGKCSEYPVIPSRTVRQRHCRYPDNPTI